MVVLQDFWIREFAMPGTHLSNTRFEHGCSKTGTKNTSILTDFFGRELTQRKIWMKVEDRTTKWEKG